MTTLWAWRVHLGFVPTSQAKGKLAKEISLTMPPVPLQAPAAPAPAAGENVTAPLTSLPHLLPVRVQKLAPAILHQVRAPCLARLLVSQAACR